MSEHAGRHFAIGANAWATVQGRLFWKYVALIAAVVCTVLVANGLAWLLFTYQDHKSSLVRIQREQAEAAAAKISQFVKEIESQLGWMMQLPWARRTLEQRRFDALRLLRQVPAITELSVLDDRGREQLRVSRMDGRRDRQRDRPLERAAVPRGQREPGVLRAGLPPSRIRALHDAGAGGRRAAMPV